MKTTTILNFTLTAEMSDKQASDFIKEVSKSGFTIEHFREYVKKMNKKHCFKGGGYTNS